MPGRGKTVGLWTTPDREHYETEKEKCWGVLLDARNGNPIYNDRCGLAFQLKRQKIQAAII